MSHSRSALVLFLNRYGHRVGQCQAEVLDVLQQTCPADIFSATMWSLGNELYEKKLNGIVPAGGYVLDIGCGTGTWTIAASRLAREVSAVDVSDLRVSALKSMASALQVTNINVVHGDVFSLQGESGSLDAVICFNTLQFIQEYDAVLRESHRLLKPGGRFYCSMADWGIVAYYLWESIYHRAPGKIVNVVKCLLKSSFPGFFAGARSANSYNGVYLRDRAFLCEARRAGFRLVNLPAAAEQEIFPKVFWKMPFFNEYVLEKD